MRSVVLNLSTRLPRLQSGLLGSALQFRGLRSAATTPAQLRALSLLRQSLRQPRQQMARVSAVAAPAQVRPPAGHCCCCLLCSCCLIV
jgi:hypothetical protein